MSQQYYSNGPGFRQTSAMPPLRQSASYPNIHGDFGMSTMTDTTPLPPPLGSMANGHQMNHAAMGQSRAPPPRGPLPALRHNMDYSEPHQSPMHPYADHSVSPGTAPQNSMMMPMSNGMPPQQPNHLPRPMSNNGMMNASRPPYASAPPSSIDIPKAHPGAMGMNGDFKPLDMSHMQQSPVDAVHGRFAAQHEPYSNSASPAPHFTDQPQQSPNQFQQPANNASQSKHVVGSQGRRGILPSAAGRPPAVTASGAKYPTTLAKDNEGKFPCPHCNKPYLHAKHLKRHMLRHTGVRPYECALCHDTFSRSDILKRHFQKCSARRGNPTGQHHLAYTRANKRAAKALQREEEKESTRAGQNAAAAAAAAAGGMYQPPNSAISTTSSNGLGDGGLPSAISTTSSFSNCGVDSPIAMSHMDAAAVAGYADRQEPLANQIARSNGMRKVSGLGGSGSNRGSTSSLNTSGFDQTNSAFSTGHATPDSVTTSGAATPYEYTHDASKSNLHSPADPSFPQTIGLHMNANNGSGSSNVSSNSATPAPGSGGPTRAPSGQVTAGAMYASGAHSMVGHHSLSAGGPGTPSDWPAYHGYHNDPHQQQQQHPHHHHHQSHPGSGSGTPTGIPNGFSHQQGQQHGQGQAQNGHASNNGTAASPVSAITPHGAPSGPPNVTTPTGMTTHHHGHHQGQGQGQHSQGASGPHSGTSTPHQQHGHQHGAHGDFAGFDWHSLSATAAGGNDKAH